MKALHALYHAAITLAKLTTLTFENLDLQKECGFIKKTSCHDQKGVLIFLLNFVNTHPYISHIISIGP